LFFASAAAIIAWFGDNFAVSIAMRTGGTDGKKTARLDYLTATLAGAAYFGR
jgi:hypothetical protein